MQRNTRASRPCGVMAMAIMMAAAWNCVHVPGAAFFTSVLQFRARRGSRQRSTPCAATATLQAGPEDEVYDFFLSHEGGKHGLLTFVQEELEKNGFRVLRDGSSMGNGHLADQFREGVKTARKVLLFQSKAYDQKVVKRDRDEHCYNEFRLLNSTEMFAKTLLCVAEREMKSSSTWQGLQLCKGLPRLDFTSPQEVRQRLEELIQEELQKPQAEAQKQPEQKTHVSVEPKPSWTSAVTGTPAYTYAVQDPHVFAAV